MIHSQIKFTLPNNIEFISFAINAVSEMAKKMNFSEDDIIKLEIGTEEAVSNVIKHAYSDKEEMTFDIILDPQPLGLKIIIKDTGVPFDPSRIHEYHPDTLEQDLSVRGLGTFLMKQFLDEVSFNNLGKNGKETQLFKYINAQRVEQLITHDDLKKVKKEIEAERLPKGSVKYVVRRMKPEEAVDVSICAYSAYGYTYVHEDLYYPERVRELNKTGALVSFVAVLDDGEVIAHGALEREEDIKVPQIGVAFTKPKYRGQGCLNNIADARLNEARKRKLTGVFARCITTHPFSQKSSIKQGLRETAIYISCSIPRIYKDIEQKIIQRESIAIFFKYLIPPDELIVYPPDHHKNIIITIFDALGLNPEFRLSDVTIDDLPDESVVRIMTDQKIQTGHIIIDKFGKNFLPETHKSLKGLCYDKIETIFLHMKLTDPYTAILCKQMESLDFFFSGIMPGSDGRDELILQYLNNHVINYDQIKLATDHGKELLQYIMEHDPNIGR